VRISTRIALGLGLLIVLFVGTAGYQLTVVRGLQGLASELAGTRLEASRLSLGVLQESETTWDLAQKSLLLGDPDYAAEWRRSERRMEQALVALAVLSLGDAETTARSRMLDAWAAWSEAMDPVRPAEGDPPPAAGATLRTGAALDALDRAELALLEFRAGGEELLEANEERVTMEAALAVERADRARLVARAASVAAILAALLVGWLFWASIAGPLARLTRGTREIARGRFEHRIPEGDRSELGALARDFNLMAEQLGELEELKRDFVSHVSHELKGPLAAVQETILVLLEELPGPINDRQRHLLELSKGSSARLSRMITDLLELSRLEAGAARYEPAPAEVRPLVQAVVDELAPLAGERDLVLELEGGEGLCAVVDGDRFQEVVANLVGNAIKFSPAGGRIRIAVAAVEHPPEPLPLRYRDFRLREAPPFVELMVADEGPGVPEDHREGVFEKFYQVRIDGRKQGQGVGLGLAISRRIVEGHGGAIWADAAPGGGGLFRVLLPVEPSRWPELEVAPPEPTDPGTPERGRMAHA
jgi:signal transduction histidine kinase